MGNHESPRPRHYWRVAVLSTGVCAILLGLVSTRLHLGVPVPLISQTAVAAGVVLLVLGILFPATGVDRVSRSLLSRAHWGRLSIAIRRCAVLLISNIPASVLRAAMLRQNVPSGQRPAAVRRQGQTPGSQPTDYEALIERARLNASFLPRIQYSMAREARSRNKQSATSAPHSTGPEIDRAALQADWPDVLQTRRQKTLGSYNVQAFDMDAPLHAVLHGTLEMTFENAAYKIEVLTWQAAPGIYMPAVLYRPAGLPGRLPVVITPPACHEDVASHRGTASMQRRMANLALSGMIVFTTEGFCANGTIKDVPGNERRFDYYTLVSGSGIYNKSLELVVWLRALNYLQTRPDTDMARVGVTGYSNGAGIAKALARVTDRIAAVAVVSSALPKTSNSDIFSDARANNNFFTKRASFYNGSLMKSPFDDEVPNAAADFAQVTSHFWSRGQLNLALNYGAPRPVYFVLASKDGHYSILDAQNAVEQMQQPWKDLGASVLPVLDVVDAIHGYNAEQQSLVRKWFVRVLDATPLLPSPDGFEYETHILDRTLLEVRPTRYPGVTLHDLYSALALKTIAARRAEFSLTALPRNQAVDRVAELLGLAPLGPEDTPRPILLDDTAMAFHGRQVRFQYWLVGSESYLRTGLLLIFAEGQSESADRIDLVVTTRDLVPSESDLQDAFENRRIVAVVVAPGFGPAAPSQSTTGNLARMQARGLSLAGMGVSLIERSVDLLRAEWPDSAIRLRANGVDAGNIAYFAVALDDRIDGAWVTQGMVSFQSILTAPSQPYVPPTLLIPGLLAEVSVDDLRWLASPREIRVVSESDLSEFHPSKP